MTLRLDGRVAIVTGAGAGLGRQHALELASRGAAVVVNDHGTTVHGSGRSESPAALVVEEIVDGGGEAVADTGSVATPEGAGSMVAQAVDTWGRLDIVVNNAGFLVDHPFEEMDLDSWRSVVGVHLDGTYHVTRAAWPHLVRSDAGRVVSTTSESGIFGNRGQSNYGSAKMGIVGLTKVLAVEGAEHGVHANAIAPAAWTRMTQIKTDEPRGADVIGPLIRSMGPELVSPLVAWLAHPSCPSTSEVFSVGGGRVARIFIGVAEGWCKPAYSAEDLERDWGSICDPARPHREPRSLFEELGIYKEELT